MIVYVVDANVMLDEPFKNKASRQLKDSQLKLKKEIDERGFTIDMHILDNEAPALCRDAIEASNSKYQLVLPNNHRRNSAERAIRKHKEHFIRMLIGIDTNFLMPMWDYLIDQTNPIVNLLR